MKLVRSLGALTLLIVFAVSCVHDIPEPISEGEGSGNNGGGTTNPPVVTCSADTVYFAQSVLPLVTSLCGKSGCHGTVNHHEFQLIFSAESQSYSAIKSRFSSVTKLNKALSEMAEQNEAGYVAPTSAQLTSLQTWIGQGLKNNSCTDCDTTQFTYAAAIAPILTTYCVSCHPAPGSSSIPNLSTLTAIQQELADHPGRLVASIEWTAPYNTATTKMPQGGSQLPSCYIKKIKKWIAAGTPQ